MLISLVAWDTSQPVKSEDADKVVVKPTTCFYDPYSSWLFKFAEQDIRLGPEDSKVTLP